MHKVIQKSSDPLVLCFVEPLLSVEDFSAHPTAFENVKNEISQSKLVDYMTSVDDAHQGVRSLENEGLKVKEVSDSDDVAQSFGDVDILIIKMSESDDNRFNTLEKHDRFIMETYKRAYEQRKNVIAVLTGELSLSNIASLIRFRRAADNPNENRSDYSEFTMKDVFVAGNNNGRAMLYAKAPPVLTLPTGTKYTLVKDAKTEVRSLFAISLFLFYFK